PGRAARSNIARDLRRPGFVRRSREDSHAVPSEPPLRGKFGAVAAFTVKRTSEGSDAPAVAAGAIAPRSGALRRAKAVRLPRAERQFERGLQPGAIIFEDKLAIVEMCDGLSEREAEPGTFRRA